MSTSAAHPIPRTVRYLDRCMAALGLAHDRRDDGDYALLIAPIDTVERLWQENSDALREELSSLATRATIAGHSIEADWFRAHAASCGSRDATRDQAPPRDYVMAEIIALSGERGSLLREYIEAATREGLVPKYRATSPGRSLARR